MTDTKTLTRPTDEQPPEPKTQRLEMSAHPARRRRPGRHDRRRDRRPARRRRDRARRGHRQRRGRCRRLALHGVAEAHPDQDRLRVRRSRRRRPIVERDHRVDQHRGRRLAPPSPSPRPPSLRPHPTRWPRPPRSTAAGGPVVTGALEADPGQHGGRLPAGDRRHHRLRAGQRTVRLRRSGHHDHPGRRRSLGRHGHPHARHRPQTPRPSRPPSRRRPRAPNRAPNRRANRASRPSPPPSRARARSRPPAPSRPRAASPSTAGSEEPQVGGNDTGTQAADISASGLAGSGPEVSRIARVSASAASRPGSYPGSG